MQYGEPWIGPNAARGVHLVKRYDTAGPDEPTSHSQKITRVFLMNQNVPTYSSVEAGWAFVRLDVGLDELSIGVAASAEPLPRDGDCIFTGIDTEHVAGWTYQIGEHQRDVAWSTADVKHAHTPLYTCAHQQAFGYGPQHLGLPYQTVDFGTGVT